MDTSRLRELLERVRAGECATDEAMEALRELPFEDLGFAKVDHHRTLRTGFPEVIFGSGKTPGQIVAIARSLRQGDHNVLVTRIDETVGAQLTTELPGCEYHARARVAIWMARQPEVVGRGTVLVVAAGTADLPVAEEAALTAELLGNRVQRLHDVGVAGIHRLLAQRHILREAAVLVVAAGMEGALPSVVAGLVDRPVIAVPTSVGYGASFGGLAALLAMLNSCAAGVTVVNIDNGFGAAVAATLINRS